MDREIEERLKKWMDGIESYVNFRLALGGVVLAVIAIPLFFWLLGDALKNIWEMFLESWGAYTFVIGATVLAMAISFTIFCIKEKRKKNQEQKRRMRNIPGLGKIRTVPVDDSVVTLKEDSDGGKILKSYFWHSLPNLLVDNDIVRISDRAFYGARDVETVVVDSCVKSIGEYAFSNCKKLTHVVFGFGIGKIPSGAFRDCSELRVVSLPDTVRFIAEDAFDGCKKLTIIASKDSAASCYAREHNIPCKESMD